ncbi:hypothetical protein BJV78DRAFT_1204170 [Lactifluus subvellereus]|nr:hypothetical protein BJV78DRAFT_1204170 [Lactifluus subvellereus]
MPMVPETVVPDLLLVFLPMPLLAHCQVPVERLNPEQRRRFWKKTHPDDCCDILKKIWLMTVGLTLPSNLYSRRC